MSLKTIMTFFLLLVLLEGRGQVGENNYFRLMREADALYSYGLFAEAAVKYAAMYRQRPTNNYAEYIGLSAMECYLASNVFDSSLFFLNKILDVNAFSDSEALNKVSDLEKLKSLPEWTSIQNKIELNRIAKEKQVILPLKEKLESMYDQDQNLRVLGDSIDRRYGFESIESKSHWKLITELDSLNMIVLDSILKVHGWPSILEVGLKGNSAVWLIIQHSSIEKQKEYLPLMRAAVLEGKASPSEFAMLEDRVAVQEGRKQIYGSQVGRDETTGQFYFLPIEDEANVNARRDAVGLEPLEYYAEYWGIGRRE
jgi:hypothetical protein